MGFATLNHHLAKWGFLVNDGKQHTPVIEAMGFREIPRAEFEALLDEHGTAVVRPGGDRRLRLAAPSGLQHTRRDQHLRDAIADGVHQPESELIGCGRGNDVEDAGLP